jgi:aspartate 1-decarboxylase
MYRTLLRSKIHRAVVTAADLHYEGSLTVDADLLDAADIRAYEQVQVVNVENGARFDTYTIRGLRGSGVIQVNGAAARLAAVCDHLIIMCYALVPEPLPDEWYPNIVLIDAHNRILEGHGKGVMDERKLTVDG